MNRKQKLEELFLFDGFEINGEQIHPLSHNRRVFLNRAKNCVITGADGDEEEALSEIIFACTLEPKTLVSYMTDIPSFKADAATFAIGLDDYTTESFATRLQEELTGTQLAAVENLGKVAAP